MPVNSKRLALAGAATAAVLGALMPTASAAPAAAGPVGVEVVPNASAEACPDKYFCLYTGANQTGTMHKKKVYWSGELRGIRSYFNNGEPQVGADHVDLSWVGGGPKCIHYWNGSGSSTPYKGTFSSAKTITEVEWRGECN
ncbi:peptidase inhibitor family I36 protein [Streptomyces sp. NPDC047525]|uniref:peptidase inhibitor family I36 protein n=1 Tax=Streptomyces sp. NPDC047525 TaxID=3155264 RepID=UPI0033CB1A3E